MRKSLVILLLFLYPALSFAGNRHKASPRDTIAFPDEFLDTVKVNRQKDINNYSLLGVNYGYSFSTFIFSPGKNGSKLYGQPNFVSLTYTYYSKLFDVMPFCGFVIGLQYGTQGFMFKPDEKGYMSDVDGATQCSISVLQIPAMCQVHIDFDPCKLMVNLGVYGGYRTSIERSGGKDFETEYSKTFRSYEKRIDYGLQGGLGFGLMFDPIEVHFNFLVRWGWSSLYPPDYENPKYHPDPQYYYRFAEPLDLIGSIGVYYQLTKRKGKTSSQLRREAKEKVYGKTQDNTGKGRR